jgi:heme a synthase
MTDAPASAVKRLRPLPSWVGTFAWGTVVVSVVLITLGGFVTSFRVGMADPVWPTEPWFLLGNTNWEFGFVIEHVHRLAGWIVGAAVTLLAMFLWNGEPDRRRRIVGFVAFLGLLLAYGEFHRGFRGTFDQIKTLAHAELNIAADATNIGLILKDHRHSSRIHWPWPSIVLTVAFAGFALYCGVRSYLAHRGSGLVRLLAVLALVAVMVQGLLGGFRVLLNALAGGNLAAIHGAFGQIAFCNLIAVAVLAAPWRGGNAVPSDTRRPLAKLAWILFGVLVVQLVWAVMLRHGGGGLWQRLHMLTAFLAAALAVGLIVRILSTPARFGFGLMAWTLAAVLAVQLALGVEAYLGKFAAMGKQAQVLPEARSVTAGQAITRTLHQVIGCALLGTAAALAIRMSRGAHHTSDTLPMLPEGIVPDFALMAMTFSDNTPGREGALPGVAAMALVPPDDGALPEIGAPDVAAIAMNPPAGLVR